MRRIIVRESSAGAARLRKEAQMLGRNTEPGRSKTIIKEGFILRAQGGEDRVIVNVIELPLYIIGAFGAIDTPIMAKQMYTQSAYIGRGGMQAYLATNKLKTDPESALGFKAWMSDQYKVMVPVGSGYVQIGNLPDWSAYRDANTDGTGDPSICPSAILITTCARLSQDSKRPCSLMVTRSHAGLKTEFYRDDSGHRDPYSYGGIKGHPFCTNAVAETADSAAVIEIGPDVFNLDESSEVQEYLEVAGPALEWGANQGLVSVLTSFDDWRGVIYRIAFGAYRINDLTDNGARVAVGEMQWVVSVLNDDLPTEDQSQEQPVLPSVAVTDYDYTDWAMQTMVYGIPASQPPLMSLVGTSYETLSKMSMWGAKVGYTLEGGAEPEAVGVISIKTLRLGLPIMARGVYNPGPGIYSYLDTPTTDRRYWRLLTYAFRVTSTGVSLTRLAAFDDSQYHHNDQLEMIRYATYGGVNALDGSPRIPVGKHKVKYKLIPATADAGLLAARPERKKLDLDSYSIRLADLSYALVSGDGTETPLRLGSYYVAAWSVDTGEPGAENENVPDGRTFFGGFEGGAYYLGNIYLTSHPFCQYAPGIMAVLVSPRSDYLAAKHDLRIALFNVSTGAMIAISPVLMNYVSRVKLSISCFEQGLVDDYGQLLAHGRIIIGASSLDGTETRVDGYFIVNELRYMSWLSREPSNTRPVYAGSPSHRAEMGVTTNLKHLKPILPE